MREQLPNRRRVWTQTAKIEGQRFYLSVGEFPDGRPGELWIEAHKTGTFARGVLDTVARVASIALQCGAELEDIVAAFKGMSFPPSGFVDCSNVRMCTSVVDWVAQELEAQYASGGV